MEITKIEFATDYDEKIWNWNGTDIDKFVASFTNDELDNMIGAMDGLFTFCIDENYFYDGGKVDAYDVVSNYIRRWIMEEVEDCEVDTARKLLDRLEWMQLKQD